MEPGKRHALRAHMPEAATDWLNSLSLGTMSASVYASRRSRVGVGMNRSASGGKKCKAL